MKPFRITVVLLALLVLPLFVTQALADFSATQLTEDFINPSTKVSANSDTLVMAFRIPAAVSGETLTTVKVRSFIELAFATERVRLWAENGTTPGWQRTEDEGLGTIITSSLIEGFQTNHVITFSGLSYELTSGDTFYVTLDMYNSYVNAHADTFHETGLEVVIDPGFIILKDGQVNTNAVHNDGWNVGPPEFFDPFILLFDTKGPQFDLHFCIEDSACSNWAYYDIEPYVRLAMVNHDDSVRICATNVESDIDTAYGIRVIGNVQLLGYVTSLHMFGVSNLKLTCPNSDPYGCWWGEGYYCDSCWSKGFRIPNSNKEIGGFKGVDADSGHWAICAYARDMAGNVDTICIGHEELPHRIDTQDPIIDEITWEFVNDWNGDGKIGLGDCIMIIAKGYSNPIEPLKECVQMRVDTSWMAGHSSSYPGGEWAVLSDTLQENNRIFRRVFCLTNPVNIDSTNCPVNFLVEAWDNACNHDTLRGEICGTMDLDPPVVDVLYQWHTDYDTMWACMGLGDKVFIEATVGGDDIVSVVAWMDSAGIDALMQHNMPLPNRGGGIYDTIWTITEPPIKYGKDRDNTQPPARDSLYRAWVVACDDVGNCDTAYGDLNKTLDTRRPRPIGYSQFCPDSVPCALVANSLAGGIIEVVWDTACDENDAYAFYVWALAPGETEFDSIGFTSVDEQPISAKYWSWHSEPLEEGYWRFKIKTEDNCSNVGDFSCEVGAYADATPPHVCIAVPDSGLTFGSWFPIKAVADSESHDVDSAILWYRLRPDIDNPLLDPGAWTRCLSYPTMYRPGGGIVFTDSVHCLEGVDYVGWVEMIVVACDEAGNCQDTTMAYDDACLVDDDVFRAGHFLFYWDTLAPGVQVVSVNGFPSPQSACGFDVERGDTNWLVIDVPEAAEGELFEVEVRGLCSGFECRIFHQDTCAMPLSIPFFVDGWPEGTQNLYVYVKDYDNDLTGNLQIDLCVPPQPPDHCIYISWPHEWMRIPCTGTSGYNCVEITAQVYDYYQCQDAGFTEVRFQWSPNGIDTWETIEDVIGSGSWSTCWDNTGSVEHGDTVYLRVIAHDEFYMADTSNIVKVFVDCEQPNVTLRIEELYYTCGNEIPKISCDPLTLKAELEDTLVDIDRIRFFFKRHSEPDLHEYWIPIDGWAEPAWSDNIWMYLWEEPCCSEPEESPSGGGPQQRDDCMWPNDYWDIRVAARDIAGQYMFDYDNDGFFDDSTFNDAVAFGAGITVYLDNEAPQPAISMVADPAAPVYHVNPSKLLGGSGKAYVQRGHDIIAEISVLPSEDSCEVMKVHWYLGIDQSWVHVGTSTDPYHYPITFNPEAMGLIPSHELDDGWWEGPLMAELHDSLGNISSDEITLYILDITPTQALITSPLNESYVWGNVPLRAMALNAYDICKLCYEFRPEGKPDWQPVNGGYPNACIIRQGFEGEPPTAPSGGGPSNPGDNCGNPIQIYIPGNLPYHDFAQTTCGRGDYDNDGCLNAWDGAQDIYYELIVTQAVDLDITLDPNGTEKTGMAIDGECKLWGYCQFKSTTYGSSPHGWTDIHLEPGTYWLQIDGRWDGPDCIPSFDLSITQHGFPLEWMTLNTVPDGVYYLRAVATDCSNNEDKNPHTIRVTVANELPTAIIEYPATACIVICPDSPEDTILYVNGTVDLYATVSSTIPVNRVEFYYKSIFGYPTTYTLIGDTADYFPTDGKYTVQWNTGSMYGRYHLMARVYNAAGRYGDSEPIEIGVDNSAPFSQIISIDGNSYPDGMDISKGDVLDIELVAIDSTSDEGWTRCYNSGLASISLCFESSKPGSEITKCFEVTPATDGFHHVMWNTSGLDFRGCDCWYYLYVIAYDCLGNVDTSEVITIYIYDITAPVTTIGGFDRYYDEERKDYLYAIYGYSDEKVSSLLFEYAPEGTNDWIPIGWSSYICDQCDYYLYKTSLDAKSLTDGEYWVRVISHDSCSNQNDSLAPVATISVAGGMITPYNPEILGEMTFEKNWCVGGMHGLVLQTCTEGTPVVFAKYNKHDFECVDMQYHLQNTTEYAGSFFADEIDHGGPAEFFSSITLSTGVEPMTGEPAYVTYLRQGSFDVVQVKRDLGTHGTYQDGCVEVTIPEGAVGGTFEYDRYIWVAPTMMPWAPVSQPDIEPIGDVNGLATYVSFTDCYYCCGWWASQYGGDQGDKLKSGGSGGSDDCCFNPGKYAKIKMCYDPDVETAKEHLAVAWWDCAAGEYNLVDDIFYPATVEGFNTEGHYVEFATTCLKGPFVVVRILERQCDGSIVVNMLDIEPYCNGYTWPWPRFTAKITDNVQGTEAIDQSSIIFKVGKTDDLTTIYNGADSGCDAWARGYGKYPLAGYDLVSGYLRAGWNDPNYYWTVYYTQSDPDLCPECTFSHMTNYLKYFYCPPATGLAAGDGYAASATAQNYNIQTCTATMEFMVDATPPTVQFADSVGAYVGKNPHFCIYFNDTEAGLDKSSIYIDIYGDETTSPDPNQHQAIGTVTPAMLNWINDTTVCVDGTFEYYGGYLHVYVYGGRDCLCSDCTTPQYYHYECGISDCVGNATDVIWRYYTVDADGPTIATAYESVCDPVLKFKITDDMSGLMKVEVYEDSNFVDAIAVDPHSPDYWEYTPSTGAEMVDIMAWDNLGNLTVHSFEIPSDCEGPTVTFADGYVCKNPTIEFWVTDPAGVDWTTVNVYINGCGEYCYFLAEDLGDQVDQETGKVTIGGCNLECSDGQTVGVYVYSGTSYTGNGPWDLNGNYGKYRYCSFVVDAVKPSISVSALDERPIRITITDARSGVDWETLEFYEDGDLVEEVDLDTETGVITYEPESGGIEVEIRVNDMTGCNLASKTFKVDYTGDDVLTFEDPHNYPNPFDPGAGNSNTTIDPGLSKDCYVTVKIYDFAGEFVTTIVSNQYVSTSEKLYWDGTTDGGTAVANGTYLCYIKAKDSAGATKTAVIKITVLKEDK